MIGEVVTAIYKTKDYDSFKHILGNRDVNDRNYRKLLKSMKEEQLIIPILVNEKYEIIDGQHRYASCKALGLPVYYYMIEGYGIEQVKKSNQVSMNWGLNEYMELHCKLNKEEYINFKKLCEKYKLRVTQLIETISAIEKQDLGKLKLEFEDGVFGIENPMGLENFLISLEDFKSFKEYNSPKFTKAFLKLYGYEKYDHKVMQKKIKNMSAKLEKRQTLADYLDLLVNDMYSFGSTKSFKYDVKYNEFYTR